ncbi:MAG: uL22 family ribosomal protein [Nanoarchaeota archaeon]|nr:hypothetical protein [Nanoarchaeota archaeon]
MENKKEEKQENEKSKNIAEAVEKKEDKEKTKKQEKKEIPKKDSAVVNAKNLGLSTKQSVAICKFIKGKKIERAMQELEEVTKMKRAIPMKGEIPHRKGIERGRYPIKACEVFIKLLKSLAANCNINGVEEPFIFISKADKASRPYRRFGSRKFKRTHITLEAKETKRKQETKNGKKENQIKKENKNNIKQEK